MRQRFRFLKNSCSELSISRPTMTAKERELGAVLTIHQSCDRGEDQDGQHRHIVGAGWVSHLPASHSWDKQCLPTVYKLNTIILWLGKTNTVKLSFSFPGDPHKFTQVCSNTQYTTILQARIYEFVYRTRAAPLNFSFPSIPISIRQNFVSTQSCSTIKLVIRAVRLLGWLAAAYPAEHPELFRESRPLPGHRYNSGQRQFFWHIFLSSFLSVYTFFPVICRLEEWAGGSRCSGGKIDKTVANIAGDFDPHI
jgi:hypothetical protein